MKKDFILMIVYLFLFLLIQYSSSGEALASASPLKIKTLYHRLDPYSVAQHLAFHELYPSSPEGQQALEHTRTLLNGKEGEQEEGGHLIPSLKNAIPALIALVNKQPNAPIPQLSEGTFAFIDKLASSLANRSLKGHFVTSETEVLELPPHEIDLSRGLLLTELGEDFAQVRSYEALIDLMALQIRARLPKEASPAEKIRTINDFIFREMGFRFPPHSLHAKDIDLYTFLPSVLDGRKGVCLGVSILYICLAQRLQLPLEMITPPGHIYVRYRNEDQEINIETTARGVHIESEKYLSINTYALQKRNIKEVIGLAHFNQAAVFWQREQYGNALASYEKAKPYLPNDILLQELLAYTYLFVGREEEGTAMLQQIKRDGEEREISFSTMKEDFLNRVVDARGIQALFIPTDETRASLIKKKEVLESVVAQYPKFRAGLFQLAALWLQLHREGEALSLLEHFHGLDPQDATAEYYLTVLYLQRANYQKAWEHLHLLERIVQAKNYAPKLLRSLRHTLIQQSPE